MELPCTESTCVLLGIHLLLLIILLLLNDTHVAQLLSGLKGNLKYSIYLLKNIQIEKNSARLQSWKQTVKFVILNRFIRKCESTINIIN